MNEFSERIAAESDRLDELNKRIDTLEALPTFMETLASLMLDANALETVARAFDREDAAQRGEPDPWDAMEEIEDEVEYRERLDCALTALEALGDYWRSLDRKAQP